MEKADSPSFLLSPSELMTSEERPLAAQVCVGDLVIRTFPLCLCCAPHTCRGAPLSSGWILSFRAQGRCSQGPGQALWGCARVLVFGECAPESGRG